MEVIQGNPSGTMVQVLCCLCGISIPPNAANTCASCLASSMDITRGITTEAGLHQCRGCQRWHKEGGKWVAYELESRELMALCLDNIKGLKARDTRLVDACWIWSEPHSMRLKVRITVQKEVQSGTILQQSFMVLFIVRNQQCTECQAEFRQGSWKSLVQVRQKVGHKRTFLYLEQLILKHGAHRGCLSIEAFKDGMDFYFPDKSKASRFMSFLENVVPVKIKMSKKLISTDDKSNISNYKFTNLVEICTLCKDDLLCLPQKTARDLGNISRIVLVKNISSLIHLIDPLSGQTASMNPEVFWRDPFRPIITAARARMTKFVVIGKEPVMLRRNVSKRTTSRKQKNRLASLTLAKEKDLGVNDTQFEERSHVGYLMKSGDVCAGYDLNEAQFVEDEPEELRRNGKMPLAIVVRKLYGGAAESESNAEKKRLWRLERLDVAKVESSRKKGKSKDADTEEIDEEDFMQEVEADRDMRQRINLYKNKDFKIDENVTMEDEDSEDDDDQKVDLEDILDNLQLNAGPDSDMNSVNSADLQMEGDKAREDGIAYVGREESQQVRAKDIAQPVLEFGKEFKLSDT